MATVSNEYRDELRDLLDDPIIDDMVTDLQAGIEQGHLESPDVIEGHGWMTALATRYRTIGGLRARTLGGPMLAVQVKLGLIDEATAFAEVTR